MGSADGERRKKRVSKGQTGPCGERGENVEIKQLLPGFWAAHSRQVFCHTVRYGLWLEKDKTVAEGHALLEKDKAEAEALGAREDAREADAARNKAEAEADGLRLELIGARLRELLPITGADVRAVLDTPQGLPGGFMRDDESEILDVLKTHNSKERDAPVELVCDIGTQYYRALDDIVNCRLAVDNAL